MTACTALVIYKPQREVIRMGMHNDILLLVNECIDLNIDDIEAELRLRLDMYFNPRIMQELNHDGHLIVKDYLYDQVIKELHKRIVHD